MSTSLLFLVSNSHVISLSLRLPRNIHTDHPTAILELIPTRTIPDPQRNLSVSVRAVQWYLTRRTGTMRPIILANTVGGPIREDLRKFQPSAGN